MPTGYESDRCLGISILRQAYVGFQVLFTNRNSDHWHCLLVRSVWEANPNYNPWQLLKVFEI